MGLLTSQPGKAVWTLFAVAFAMARMPLWILYYLSPSLRPHPSWSFAQAIKVQITSVFLYHASVVEMKTPLSLAPGVEKEVSRAREQICCNGQRTNLLIRDGP